jgi:hypothetical protein
MSKFLPLHVRQVILGAAALATVSVGVAPAAYAQSSTLIPGVTGCDAPGGQQTGGALIGALVGAALGSNLSRGDRTTGATVGAALGAGVGSYVGCRRQRARGDYGQGFSDNRYRPSSYAPSSDYGPQPRYDEVGYGADDGYQNSGYYQPRYEDDSMRYGARAPYRSTVHHARYRRYSNR